MPRRPPLISKKQKEQRKRALKQRWEIFRRKKQAKVESGPDGVDKGEGEEEGDDVCQEVVKKEDGGRGATYSCLSNESSCVNQSEVISI